MALKTVIALKVLQSPRAAVLCCQRAAEVFGISFFAVQFGPFEGLKKPSVFLLFFLFPFLHLSSSSWHVNALGGSVSAAGGLLSNGARAAAKTSP